MHKISLHTYNKFKEITLFVLVILIRPMITRVQKRINYIIFIHLKEDISLDECL